MDYYNESGCFSIQMNESKQVVFEPKLIISSSPLVTNRMKSHHFNHINNKQTGLSLKAKLKSKIFRMHKNTANTNNTENWTSFSLYEKITHSNPSLVAQFCKIMDKSLGWFKTKKLKKQRKLNNTNAKNNNLVKEELIYENMTLPDQFEQTNTSFQFISTPIKICNSFKTPLPVTSPIDMSSNGLIVHSTPCSTYNRRISLYSKCCSSFNSTRSSSCYSSRSFTRSRIVFGMTSSPNTSVNDFDDQELNESSIQANNGLIETNINENKNEFSSLDSKEKLLVEHLNLIKENVRIGYELRNLKTTSTVKRNHFLMEEENSSQIDQQKNNLASKKRKLQNIFQTKLQQQLKEVKKWQFNFKKNSKSSNNLSTSTKRAECIHIDDALKHACQCLNCQNNYYF